MPTGEPIDFTDVLPDATADIAEALKAATDATGAPMTPTDDTAKEAPAAPETPAEPEPAAEPAAEETVEEAADRIFLEGLKDLHNLDFTGKYKNDDELVKGIDHLQKMLGQRNADAEYGRRVLQAYGDVFQQQQVQQQLPQYQQPVQEQPIPSREQLLLWQSQVRKNAETGAYEPIPGAEAGVVEKLQGAQDRMQQALLTLAYDPDGFLQSRLSPILQSVVQQANQQVAQQFAAQQAQQQREREAIGWMANNSGWVFRNKTDPSGGFTSEGEQFTRTYDTLGLQALVDAGRMTLTQAMDTARGYMAATRPQPKQVAPPRQQAAHVPNVAAMPAVEVDEYAQKDGEYDHDHLVRVLASVLAKEGSPG